MYSFKVGGIHPTGMLSCFIKRHECRMACVIFIVAICSAADICDLKILKRSSEVRDNPILRCNSNKGGDVITPTKAPTRYELQNIHKDGSRRFPLVMAYIILPAFFSRYNCRSRL